MGKKGVNLEASLLPLAGLGCLRVFLALPVGLPILLGTNELELNGRNNMVAGYRCCIK